MSSGIFKLIVSLITIFIAKPLMSQALDDSIDFSNLTIDCKRHHSTHHHNNSHHNNYDLTYQQLILEVSTDPLSLSGNIYSEFIATATMDSIVFDCHAILEVDSIFFGQKKLNFIHHQNRLIIFFDTSLTKNSKHNLQIYYNGDPTQLGRRSFEHISVDGAPLIWTLSEPYGAKDWWPCKESLTDKLDSVDIIVKTPKTLSTASNGLLQSELIEGDFKTTHWKHKYPIPSYLIAFAVSEYDTINFDVQLTQGSLPVVNYLFPNQKEHFRNAVKSTEKFLHLFDTLFTPYPFMNEKYGHVMMGENRGGMEHTTISFMSTFTFDLISHELAHQWFGDYITCGTWEDIWLNESFATYSTGLSYERLSRKGSFYKWKQAIGHHILSQTDGSIAPPDTLDVGRLFSSRLTYHKGAYFLHMIRHTIGDKPFFNSIKSYLNDSLLAYDFAYTEDFIDHLKKHADGPTIDELFNDWFYGEGYPSYTTIWEQNGDNLELLIQQTSSHSSVSFYEMPIEYHIISENSDTTLVRVENTHNDQTIDLQFSERIKKIEFNPFLNVLSKNNFISKKTKIGELEVYPNPTNSSLQIDLIHPTGVIQNLYIFDYLGKEVHGKIEHQLYNKNKLHIDHLADGIYYINIETSVGKYTKKIVKTSY